MAKQKRSNPDPLTVPLNDLVNCEPSLRKFLGTPEVKPTTALRLGRLKRALMPELAGYYEQRQRLLEVHGTQYEKPFALIEITPEQQAGLLASPPDEAAVLSVTGALKQAKIQPEKSWLVPPENRTAFNEALKELGEEEISLEGIRKIGAEALPGLTGDDAAALWFVLEDEDGETKDEG